jgi:hypothetical protein
MILPMILLRKNEVRQASYISLHYCLGSLIRQVTVQVGSILKNSNLFGAHSNSSSHDTRDIEVSFGPLEAFEEGKGVYELQVRTKLSYACVLFQLF